MSPEVIHNAFASIIASYSGMLMDLRGEVEATRQAHAQLRNAHMQLLMEHEKTKKELAQMAKGDPAIVSSGGVGGAGGSTNGNSVAHD